MINLFVWEPIVSRCTPCLPKYLEDGHYKAMAAAEAQSIACTSLRYEEAKNGTTSGA